MDITTNRYLRALGIFIDQKGTLSSISSAGGVGGGALTIRNGGATPYMPFVVGDATQNGTTGAITSGNSYKNTISPLQSFTYSYHQGNTRIISRLPEQNLIPLAGPIQTQIVSPLSSTTVDNLEDTFTSKVSQYVGVSGTSITKPEQASALLRKIQQQTGVKSAFVYVSFASAHGLQMDRDNDRLELRLVTGQDKTIFKPIEGTTRKQVLSVAAKFREEITRLISKHGYLVPGQQLNKWLIEPIEDTLNAQGIQNLVFIMDSGLRSLPVAALHNGKTFLVERYSVGMMPSLSLTDTSYADIKNAEVLAMGADKFTDQEQLRAVPAELAMILQERQQSKSFLNEKFTLENLKAQRQRKSYKIIHLATHGEFKPGSPGNSYIQMWDKKLRLDDLRQMGWNKPPVELLVLSACQTALGNEDAELGFAGFAVQAGVKSALASLWYVSDEGTLGLMTDFYKELRQAPIKAEALRRAQVAMLKGQVRIEGNSLNIPGEKIALPSGIKLANRDFSHPYYWAAFTMIGSPW